MSLDSVQLCTTRCESELGRVKDPFFWPAVYTFPSEFLPLLAKLKESWLKIKEVDNLFMRFQIWFSGLTFGILDLIKNYSLLFIHGSSIFNLESSLFSILRLKKEKEKSIKREIDWRLYSFDGERKWHLNTFEGREESRF